VRKAVSLLLVTKDIQHPMPNAALSPYAIGGGVASPANTLYPSAADTTNCLQRRQRLKMLDRRSDQSVFFDAPTSYQMYQGARHQLFVCRTD
jgi:hypothetical protein